MFLSSMVLPTPLGPMNTTLAASSMKASECNSWINERSHCFGHAQSNSARSLNVPRRASSMRRLRLRRCRSISSISRTRASQGSCINASACEARPYRPSARKRSRSAWTVRFVVVVVATGLGRVIGWVLIGTPCQLIVIVQRMGAHAEFAHPRISRQRHRDRRGKRLGARVLIDEVAHRAQVHGVLGERGLDGPLQGLST